MSNRSDLCGVALNSYKELILFFDDFERSKIDRIDLMGAINGYSENKNIKVIIIADEEKIKSTNNTDNDNKYEEFKEKLVSRTIQIKYDYQKAIESIVNSYIETTEGYKDFLKTHIGTINKIFTESQVDNLRSVKAFITDYERVYTAWNNSNVPLDLEANVFYMFGAMLFGVKGGFYKEGEYGYIFSDVHSKELFSRWSSTYELYSVQKWITKGIWDDQSDGIEQAVAELDNKIDEHGFPLHAIHSGPIIRNEGFYKNYDSEDRKRLFNDLLFFTKKVAIRYQIVSVDKKQFEGKRQMIERLSKQFALFVRENLEYFNGYDKVIVYYDYGQSEITTILTSVLNSFLVDVDFRHVQPHQYKLFQVADMICTLELSKLKYDSGTLSQSEENFYGSRRKFRDFYYKTIKNKKI